MKQKYIYFSILISVIILLTLILKRYDRVIENLSELKSNNTTTFTINENKFSLFNPSLEIYDGDTLISTCRKSNASECSMYRGGRSLFWRSGVINENLIVFIDKKSLVLKTTRPLNLPPAAREKYIDSGIEDLRIFYFAGELWFCGATRDYNKNGIYEIFISNNKVSFVSSETEHQKNWAPLIYREKLFFITNFNPFTIIQFAAGEFSQAHVSMNNFPNFRGNTPFIETERGRLGIVHLKISTKTKIKYANYFILLSNNYPFSIQSVSRAFSLSNSDIEFYIGIVREGNRVIVSYGLDDCRAGFSELMIDDIWKLFIAGAEIS